MGLALPGLTPSFLLRLIDITGVSFALILFGCALGPFPCCLGHDAPAPSDSWDADGGARVREEMGSVRARLRTERRGRLQGLGVVDFHVVPVTWTSELSLKLPLPKDKHETVAVPECWELLCRETCAATTT